MPIPRAVAKINKRVTNKVTGVFAPLVPGFALVEHTGPQERDDRSGPRSTRFTSAAASGSRSPTGGARTGCAMCWPQTVAP